MNFFLKFYNGLGNSKGQRFTRLVIIMIILGLIWIGSTNIGYDSTKGGWYLKPNEVSIHKNFGNSGE